MDHKINLDELAEGAVNYKFNEELRKVLSNIADPNTEPHKRRTITLTIGIWGDDSRDVLNADVVAKSKLLPAKEAQTKIMMGPDEHGNFVGKELKSGVKGQLFLDRDGDVAKDDGEKIETNNSDRVISFRDKNDA